VKAFVAAARHVLTRPSWMRSSFCTTGAWQRRWGQQWPPPRDEVIRALRDAMHPLNVAGATVLRRNPGLGRPVGL